MKSFTCMMLAATFAPVCLASILAQTQPVLGSREVPIVTVDDLQFRDLNKDGKLEPYEDWRLTPRSERTICSAGCRSKRSPA